MVIKRFCKIFITGLLSLNTFILPAPAETPGSPEIEEIQAAPENLTDLQNYNLKIAGELIRAIDAKKLKVSLNIEIQFNQLAIYGYAVFPEKKTDSQGTEHILKHRAYASKDLLDLLLALVNAPETSPESPVSILSLLRFGGAHGELQENGDLVGRAVDIDNFAGNRIHIDQPEVALQGILKIIKNLPPTRYTLGLPRPGGGNLVQPENDFFLPVKNPGQNRKSPTGTIKGDLMAIRDQAARQELSDTINHVAAEILFLYPDETNHIHIKTVEKSRNQ